PAAIPAPPQRAPLPRLDVASIEQSTPERITIDELRALWARHAPVLLVDVRTDRTYRNDPLRARGAVRVPPDDVVRTARALRLEQHATLVLYCACVDDATSARAARRLPAVPRRSAWAVRHRRVFRLSSRAAPRGRSG